MVFPVQAIVSVYTHHTHTLHFLPPHISMYLGDNDDQERLIESDENEAEENENGSNRDSIGDETLPDSPVNENPLRYASLIV